MSLLKKPTLTSKEYETALEEEEQTLDLLYDFYALDAWLNHPVKRFKPDSKEHQRNLRWSKNGDLYSLFAQQSNNSDGGCASSENKSSCNINNSNNINNNNQSANGVNVMQNFMKQEIKMEPGCPVSKKQN